MRINLFKHQIAPKVRIIISFIAIPLLILALIYVVEKITFIQSKTNEDLESKLDKSELSLSASDYLSIYEDIDKRRESATNANRPQTTAYNTPYNNNTPTTNPSYYSYPSVILPCTRNGNDLLVLVNKQYQLPSTYAPSDLVPATNAGIRTTRSDMYVRNNMITDLQALDQALKAQGIDVAILSAYRSYATQQATYNYWVTYNSGNVNAADQVSARPGHSQHQLGTAVDFTTNEIGDALGAHFGNTRAGQWLLQNSWQYGFVLSFPAGWEHETGFSYEPWHYRYIGRENAQAWKSSGLILEIWLRGYN